MRTSLKNNVTTLCLFLLSVKYFTVAVTVSMIWLVYILVRWLAGHVTEPLEHNWKPL
jgi:hypothetical protein